MQEARDIMAGKVEAESYDNASELFATLDKQPLMDVGARA